MGKMRQFRRELRSAVGKPLLYQIKDGYGAALSVLIERVVRGDRVHDAEIKDAFDESPISQVAAWDFSAGPMIIPGGGKGQKATALVSCRGVALYDLEFQPYAYSTLLLSQTINTLAADSEIGTIVLDIDSPGGAVTGTQEAADSIYAARKRKKMVALVNPLAASAAYWIASQCHEIVAVPSADVGSVGVFMAHTDCSAMMEQMGVKTTYIHAGAHKVEGNPNEPLSEEARTYYQMEVDTIYASFLKAVSRGRGVSVEDVEKKYGQGRTLMAPAAKRAGMVDRVETIDMAMSRFGLFVSSPQQGGRRGEAAAGDIDFSHLDVPAKIDAAFGPAELTESQKQALADIVEAHEAEKKQIQADIVRSVKAGLDAGGDDETETVDGKTFDDFDSFTAIQFTTESEDGVDILYVMEDWPNKLRLSTGLIAELDDVTDDTIGFAVENGIASYRKIGEHPETGDWLFELVEGVYEPMTEEASEQEAETPFKPLTPEQARIEGGIETTLVKRGEWMREGTVVWSSDDAVKADDEAIKQHLADYAASFGAPVVELSREDWHMQLTNPPEFVLVGRSTVGGFIFHERFAIADLPNDVVTAEDMKRLGLTVGEVEAEEAERKRLVGVRRRHLALLKQLP